MEPILFALAALLVIAFLVWGAYQLERDQRYARTQHNQDYQSPSSNGQRIRWGDVQQSDPSGSNPIVFGEELQERQWTQVSPSNNVDNAEGTLKCPLCKKAVDQYASEIFECSNCQAVYHLDCWQEWGQICPNCRVSSS